MPAADDRPTQRLTGRRVVVGVSGGIAAYKAAALVRLLTEAGAEVTVIPTESALRFVGAATWSALSGHPVATTVWDNVDQVQHVRLGQEADLVVVAPATANLLARAAAGMADDLLTTTLLAARGPVLLAPAMHTEMWDHAATQANVATLRARGVHVLDPAVGRLTGADSGPGRLPEPEQIALAAADLLLAGGDLTGVRALVSAGGTREAIDPVRFLGNRSSGRQGYALAAVAARRGADVTLVTANVALPPPRGVRCVPVVSAADLQDAMTAGQPNADVIVMCAAVADFRPVTASAVKLKKDSGAEPTDLKLERTPDVLRALVAGRPAGQTIVGFAAETGDSDGDVLAHGRRKLAAKGCDLLVVNDVSGELAFEQPDNQVVILGSDDSTVPVARSDKEAVAAAIWDRIAAWRRGAPR